MPVAEVQKVRARAVLAFERAIALNRQYLSMVGGNNEAIELLRGDNLTMLLASIVETYMEHIGHVTVVAADQTDARSKARRAVSRRV